MDRYALGQMGAGHPNSQAVVIFGGGSSENDVNILQNLYCLDWDKIRIPGSNPDTVQGALLI
jgi:hypothetical protein